MSWKLMKLTEALYPLEQGATMRFIHSECTRELITVDQGTFRLHGSTYQALIKRCPIHWRTGSLEEKSLVMFWRMT